ncbi:hypothetical protein DID77_04435 [Candidatus Marinamargulisbacteria bacterium SCGC AG-439-L15]|nr:hypothetical protein DID77_04435 [Candidatus Marinamargulisbacteria bacterium SCGC AG-439-L15]
MYSGNCKRGYIIGLMIAVVMVLSPLFSYGALTPGVEYRVVLERLTSDGEGAIFTHTTVTADANGIIEYAFDNVPNCDGADSANFLIVSVIKESDWLGYVPNSIVTSTVTFNVTEESMSVVPAPPENTDVFLGLNALSKVQTKGIIRSFKVTGKADPLIALIGMVVFRDPDLSDSDIQKISLGIADQIFYPGEGFYAQLSAVGVSDEKIATFQKALVCESFGAGEESFVGYMRETYDSNSVIMAGGDEGAAREAHIKAGERLGAIVINAAEYAEIDMEDLLHAVESLDFEDTDEYAFDNRIEQLLSNSLSTFFQRIYVEGTGSRYRTALAGINASDSQASRFESAFSTLISSVEELTDPDIYEFSDSVAAFDDSRDSQYDSAQYQFAVAIQSTEAEINALIDTVADIIGFDDPTSYFNQNYGSDDWGDGRTVSDNANSHWIFDSLRHDYGTFFAEIYDSGSGQYNYLRASIPQTVAFQYVADHLQSGGTFSYTWVDIYGGCDTDENVSSSDASMGMDDWWESNDPTVWLWQLMDLQWNVIDLQRWRSDYYNVQYYGADDFEMTDITKCYSTFLDTMVTNINSDMPAASKKYILNLFLRPDNNEDYNP